MNKNEIEFEITPRIVFDRDMFRNHNFLIV